MKPTTMTPLRKRMIDEMTLRGYPGRSIEVYAWAVQQRSRFHGLSPEKLSDELVRSYLVYLTAEKKEDEPIGMK
jgi:hypothetical protein